MNNIEATVRKTSRIAIRELHCIEQAFGPVRWVDCIVMAMQVPAARRHIVIECGPGKVLAGLVKRIDGELAQSGALFDAATPGRCQRGSLG